MSFKQILANKSTHNSTDQELSANQEIDQLMDNLELLIKEENPLMESIVSPSLLKRSLTDLLKMVEMVHVKKTVVAQIQFLLVNKARRNDLPDLSEDSKFENHMLHTVISGKPGTGKTTVAMILAKIWMALGFIKSADSINANKKPSYSDLEIKIQELEVKNEVYKHKLRKGSEMLLDEYVFSKKLISQTQNFKKRCDFRKTPYPSKRQLNNIPESIANIKTHLEDISSRFFYIQNYLHTSSENLDDTVEIPQWIDPYTEKDPKFVKATREDLVGEYIGQTAVKTKKVLESALGGVLFIDEAYSIVNPDSSKDFGHECLTLINEYMSLYPEQLVVIFAGYKDKLDETIFKTQPGLARRCSWIFDIEEYSASGLARISENQLIKECWKFSPDVNLVEFIQSNQGYFPDSGGSTEKFMLYCKLAYSQIKFEEIISSPVPIVQDSLITKPILDRAFELMCKNQVNIIEDKPILGMYL